MSGDRMKIFKTGLIDILLVLILAGGTNEFSLPGSGSPNETAWAVPGNTARLYCQIQGEVSTVLWYREDYAEPIYTYDARTEGGRSAYHWSEDEPVGLGQRADFITDTEPAYLHVSGVQIQDTGIYRCRVDFKHAQTRNRILQLSLVEDPTSLTIYQDSQEVGHSAGPVNSGSSVHLICIAEGGKPSPTLLWHRNNLLLDSSMEEKEGRVRNELIIPRVGEKEATDSFSCSASNNNITQPLVRSLRIEINFPPSKVEISQLPKDIYAGKTQYIKCSAVGSYPSAAISWWKDGQYLQRPAETNERNGTVSYLYIKFTREDNGRILTCRAQNPLIENSVVEQKIRLNIQYSPQTDLQFGANINPENIREGQDVYLECRVDSNPKLNKILWSFNGFPVLSRKNVIMSGKNLVLQGVRRDQGGNYTCTVSNHVGDAVSKPVSLVVKHKPVCTRTGSLDLQARFKDVLKVLCQVDAHPSPTNFWWTFNNSFQLGKLPQDQYEFKGEQSTLLYKPILPSDYGVLSCWSSNPLGTMEQPCSYNIKNVGTEQRTLECNLHNQTLTSLIVSCTGEEGQIQQDSVYHLEVREREGGELVQNLTSDSPWFFIQDLPPEVSTSGLNLTVYTSDLSGRSGSRQTLGVLSSKVAELQAESSESSLPYIYLLGAGIGSLLSVLSILLGIIIFIRISRRESHQGSIGGVGGGGGEGEDGKLTEVGYVGVDLLQAVNQPRQVHLRDEVFLLKQVPSSTRNLDMESSSTRGLDKGPGSTRVLDKGPRSKSELDNLKNEHQGCLKTVSNPPKVSYHTLQYPRENHYLETNLATSKTLSKNLSSSFKPGLSSVKPEPSLDLTPIPGRKSLNPDFSDLVINPKDPSDYEFGGTRSGFHSSESQGGSRDPLIQRSLSSLLVNSHPESIL